jgi:hypothetical protein
MKLGRTQAHTGNKSSIFFAKSKIDSYGSAGSKEAEGEDADADIVEAGGREWLPRWNAPPGSFTVSAIHPSSSSFSPPMTLNRSLPACPHCHREFETTTAVVSHLNNPYSSCTNWYVPPGSQPNPPSNPVRVDPGVSPHVKFPFSGHIFSQGDSFMDNFYADKFSDHRTSNVYYPFASRDEWELGAFLTEADILMKVIDKFLSLQLVSCYPLDPSVSVVHRHNSGSQPWSLFSHRKGTPWPR